MPSNHDQSLIISVLKETYLEEKRACLDPQSIKKIKQIFKWQILVENNLGEGCFSSNKAYEKVGAKIEKKRETLLKKGDVVLTLNRLNLTEMALMKQGAIYISLLDIFNSPQSLVKQLNKKKITAIAMELIPRSTKAQKFDVLSSQASLAGYAAVMLASNYLRKVFPMMTTPAGTINPSRVFVIGAGVAGLQAIATAKRLGARVEAYDTREIATEQIESLGAKAVKINVGKTEQTSQGYAKKMTQNQLLKQKQLLTKYISLADVVITTAKVFGKKAPKIIDRKMIDQMRAGSVIVDLAMDTGGNVEGSKKGEVIQSKNGVFLIGKSSIEGMISIHSSQVYAANITSLLIDFSDQQTGEIKIDLNDPILSECVVTYGGKTISPFVTRS